MNDFDEVSTLLRVVEATAQHGGKLSEIGGAAMARLTEINDSLKAAKTKPAEPGGPRPRVVPEEPKGTSAIPPNAYPSSRTETMVDRRA